MRIPEAPGGQSSAPKAKKTDPDVMRWKCSGSVRLSLRTLEAVMRLFHPPKCPLVLDEQVYGSTDATTPMTSEEWT